MSGVLYIVATPIGNLDDITLRAIKTLQAVDIIAAEDTRHSQRLLSHLGIRKKMISLHQHNEHQRLTHLLEKLQDGEDIALISDAGTPLISDPGYPLVRAVRAAGLQVCPIPGASSIITALSAAGLPTEPFSFVGFLSQKNTERLQVLARLRQQAGTLVLLESSHRIQRLMEQLVEVMPEHRIVVAKELTKTHENFLDATAAEILVMFAEDPALTRGEFVVLIDNPLSKDIGEVGQAERDMLECLLSEVSLKKAVELTCRFSGRKKNDIYPLALAMNQQAKNS